MSLDNAIRAIAFAEAPTLGGAIALIAKHRNDLDAALRAAEVKSPQTTAKIGALERALEQISPLPQPEAHAVDKTA